MKIHRGVVQQCVLVALVEIACTALMLGVYVLLERFSREVLVGGLLGCALSIINFLLLSHTVSRAADRAEQTGDHAKAALSIRSSGMTRMLGIGLVLILAFRAGICDPIAALLPLIFLRLSMMVAGFVIKDGGTCK